MTAKEKLTDIGQQIQRVYNPDLIEIIILRYIKGKSQEKTAEILGISYRTEQRMEQQALEIFEAENVQNVQKNV